jgi:glycine C-acetyltransferase
MSMGSNFLDELRDQLNRIKQEGLFKGETELFSPQNSSVILAGEQICINLCANNYLGLANHPAVVDAARSALSQFGFGMASVRFICGTQDLHHALERKISDFLNGEDTILYSSCFDANTGLFGTLLGSKDAIISDSLNHASIIDGVRLCKANRYRYANNDMAELEIRLQEARNSRYRLIATDGVFSMDGSIANLPSICDLAEKYDAMVMVDDSHAVGVLGANGRGTPEYCGVEGRIDILTGTLGKALGGASGGYVCGRREVVEWLRQRSRPYLFSNTLAPVVAAGSLAAIEFVMSHPAQRGKLHRNSAYFRQGMSAAGFDLLPGTHPIVPVMIRDTSRSVELARRLRGRGVMVTPFSYPVVPHGEDRIRTQISALHEISELDHAIEQFDLVARELGLKG